MPNTGPMLKIVAELANYDDDPTHTTTGHPEFLYASIWVECHDCPLRYQADDLAAAERAAKQHAATHLESEAPDRMMCQEPRICAEIGEGCLCPGNPIAPAMWGTPPAEEPEELTDG